MCCVKVTGDNVQCTLSLTYLWTTSTFTLNKIYYTTFQKYPAFGTSCSIFYFKRRRKECKDMLLICAYYTTVNKTTWYNTMSNVEFW
jgi:hypothetical protein